jgi:hypothetical protein
LAVSPRPPRSAGTRSGRGLKLVQPSSGPALLRADERRLRREFIVGGGNGAWHDASAHALPAPFDDLSRDFGPQVYAEMQKDPQVAAALVVLKASILEDGLMLKPAIDDQKAKGYKRAVKIRDLATKMLGRLQYPLDAVLWNMLDAMAFGNKVAEQVFAWQDVKGEGRLLMLTALKPKPRTSVAFVVDQFMNLLGVIGQAPGQSALQTRPLLNPKSADIIQPDKVMILTHRAEDCDPRGTSILRPAYEPWWKKRQLGPEYLHYLSQFASPSVWATPPEGGDDSVPATDALGNLVDDSGEVVEDPDAEPEAVAEPLSKMDELLAVIMAWRNGYAMVAPAGTMLHTVEMQGDGAPFLNAFNVFDVQIVKAILTQTLATEEGAHQSRASSGTHQDVLDTLVRQGKQAVVEMVQTQVLEPWVRRNWGDDAADELVPVPSLGTTERPDLPALMTAVAALMRSAFFHSSQLSSLDDMLSLPVRDWSQPNLLQPPASPAPGESSAPDGGEMGKGGSDGTDPNPGAPSGPAERGGRGKQPSRQPARKDQP